MTKLQWTQIKWCCSCCSRSWSADGHTPFHTHTLAPTSTAQASVDNMCPWFLNSQHGPVAGAGSWCAPVSTPAVEGKPLLHQGHLWPWIQSDFASCGCTVHLAGNPAIFPAFGSPECWFSFLFIFPLRPTQGSSSIPLSVLQEMCVGFSIYLAGSLGRPWCAVIFPLMLKSPGVPLTLVGWLHLAQDWTPLCVWPEAV